MVVLGAVADAVALCATVAVGTAVAVGAAVVDFAVKQVNVIICLNEK